MLAVLHFNAALKGGGPSTLPHTLLYPPLLGLLISQGHTAFRTSSKLQLHTPVRIVIDGLPAGVGRSTASTSAQLVTFKLYVMSDLTCCNQTLSQHSLQDLTSLSRHSHIILKSYTHFEVQQDENEKHTHGW